MKLKVGDKMPNFTYNTAFETGKEFKDALEGKTVLWVLRYIGCPSCRYDCHLITQRHDEFKAKGAKVIMLMQSDAEHIKADMERTNETFPFEIICDTDQAIYKEFEINPAASMEELVGDDKEKAGALFAAVKEAGFVHGDYEGDEQQLPALFIIDEEGTITYAKYAKSLVDMPSIDEVLALL